MNTEYIYKCSNCGKEYSSDKVENELIYLCPNCGEAKRNTPLKGVLEIVYDYESLRKRISFNDLIKRDSGDIRSYIELLPIKYDSNDRSIESVYNNDLNRLRLPQNSVVKKKIDEQDLLFLDETRNPTYSYKDRASIPVVVKARQMGIEIISTASTGNAGSSLAGVCAMLGMKSKIFVPKNIPEAKRIQIQSFGSELFVVDGDYDEAFDLCLEISQLKNWYNRNTAYNPITIDGKKTSAFDIFIQTKGDIPDLIFVPVGDGVILSGIYKGFLELFKLRFIEYLPKLIAVQAEGSSAVFKYYKTNEFAYNPAKSVADSISAGAPRNLFLAVQAIRDTYGEATKVSDDEILLAQNELARLGFLVEPSCAAAFAGYKNFRKNISSNAKVLILLTGSGMKDFDSLKMWNSKPNVQSIEEIKKALK